MIKVMLVDDQNLVRKGVRSLLELSDEIEVVVADTQAAMAEASRVVLAGFELRTDGKIIRHPGRYSDPRGECMWETVMGLMAELPQAEWVDSVDPF